MDDRVQAGAGAREKGMITTEALTKRYGTLEVLRGVDLELEPGAVTAIAGPNGSGKTTLLKIVLGLVRPDSGRVWLDGRLLDGCPDYRARIGYMPQAARFPENLNGDEVLRLLRELRGPGAPLDEELIDAFGLARELGKPVRTLSGGNRQKLSAVAAFLFRPSLVIMDEPSAGLDPTASSTLKDKILRERENGVTFILTSHVMAELEELSDSVVFLLNGRVRFQGPTDAVKLTTGQVNLERAVAELMREVAA